MDKPSIPSLELIAAIIIFPLYPSQAYEHIHLMSVERKKHIRAIKGIK